MAALTERRTSVYGSYGNVAYAPGYAGGTVRIPAGEEVYRPRPRVKPRERALVRPKVDVRPAGQVAPFAVAGFLAVAVVAALLVFSYVQLAVLGDQTAELKSQLSALQTENTTLTAEFEKTFDMASLQEAVGSYMTKPTAEQYIYIDLSEADEVVVYGQEEGSTGVAGMVRAVGEVVDNVTEYLR